MRGLPIGRALLAAAALAAVVSGLLPGAHGGYVAKITNSTDTAGSAPYFTCSSALAADRASAFFQLPLTETSGSTSASDTSGNGRTGTYQGSMTTASSPGACSRDGGTAYVLNGSTSAVTTATASKQTNPTTFSLELWFRTSTASGKLIGFGSSQTGASGQYDRQLYLTTAGLLTFGVYDGSTRTISTTTSVVDGAWHHAVATFAPAGAANAGMTLYLDGKQVAANASYTSAENFAGWWRIGYDAQSGWPGVGTNAYFTGAMRFASVYTTALTAKQVADHYNAGR